jgi:hypothetical protein
MKAAPDDLTPRQDGRADAGVGGDLEPEAPGLLTEPLEELAGLGRVDGRGHSVHGVERAALP